MDESTLEHTNCGHHWVIDKAEGPTSSGRCKNCGMTKEFLNSIDAVIENNEARKQLIPALVAGPHGARYLAT
jgi:hypothetical protein